MENGRFAFLVRYDVHLRLIGKRVVDFLLVLIDGVNGATVRQLATTSGVLAASPLSIHVSNSIQALVQIFHKIESPESRPTRSANVKLHQNI